MLHSIQKHLDRKRGTTAVPKALTLTARCSNFKFAKSLVIKPSPLYCFESSNGHIIGAKFPLRLKRQILVGPKSLIQHRPKSFCCGY